MTGSSLRSAKAEVGKIYRGKVVTIKEFGAFVEFMPGRDGLCHISELANFRVKQVEDIVKMGDEIWVKCLEIDEKGKVRLSRRAAMVAVAVARATKRTQIQFHKAAPAMEPPFS